MINSISKYKIKNFKQFNLLKKKEFSNNLKKSLIIDNKNYSLIIRNYILIFFFYSVKKYNNEIANNIRLRCIISTNSHSIYNIFGLNRIILRKFISFGYINGYFKASW